MRYWGKDIRVIMGPVIDIIYIYSNLLDKRYCILYYKKNRRQKVYIESV